MLFYSLFWAATASLVLVSATIVYHVVFYFIDPKGLRRYPAPSIAGFTPLWQMYHNWRGKKFLAVDKAHKQLGAVVRLGPSHVSFSSTQAFKDIYGHGTVVRKDIFYDNQAAGNPNMADATDKEVHRNKRRNLAHVFSPAQITQMEPRVMAIVHKLLQALEKKSRGLKIAETDRFPVVDGVFDIRPWLNMFSYDAITNVFWSQTYGFLDNGDDECMAERKDGTFVKVHAMHTFHTGAAHSVLIGHLSPFWYDLVRNKLLGWTEQTKCGNTFTDMARYLTHRRLQSPPPEPDLFSNLPIDEKSRRGTRPMEDREIIAESSVMLNAGNDTTQTSLTNTIFYIATHPRVQVKLREVLRDALDENHIPVAPYEKLRHIAYLRAVIDESFRMQAPLGTGLPRLTTKPTVIDGELIPQGVTVSAQTWSLQRRDDLFHRAGEWIPERWLPSCEETSDEERENLKNFVLPFSMGPRACIGRNLAYMELSICIAALVLAFSWELPEGAGPLEHHERFNCNPIKLPIRARYLM